MPAVGKSTVGVVVAKRLGYEFIDTDLLIQKQENRLLREIIAEEGLDGFLSIENQVNRDVEAEHAVISPGGSVVYCEEAMKHYKEIGTIVYLHASFEVINSRLKNAKKRGVALRDGQTLKALYDERVVLFEKYAERLSITKVRQTKNFIEVYLPFDLVENLDIQNLFLDVTNLSRMFRFSTKQKQVIITLDIVGIDKHFIYYLVDLAKIIENNKKKK